MTARNKLAAESAFSLVEVMITIVIVGIAFAAILDGLLTALTVSSVHRQQAAADVVARSAAEWVKDDAKNPYDTTSPNPNSYSLATLPIPSGYAAAIPTVRCWDGGSLPAGSGYNLSSISHFTTNACTAADNGMQLITIAASSTDGRVTEAIDIIKRRQ